MTFQSKTLRALLLGTTLIGAAGGIASAQQPAAPTFDPAQLPQMHGTVGQYSLTPRGDVDGLILTDGTEVHLPPHLGTQLVFIARPGDAVTIHGLRARAVAMVQAMEVTNDASHRSVIDLGPEAGGPAEHGPEHGPMGEHVRAPGHEHGPKGMHGERGTPMDAAGAVKQLLHGPRGEVNGVLLSDGTIVRMPPPEATRLADQLTAGKTVAVRGEGTVSPLGRVIGAREIGPDAQHLTTLRMPQRGEHGPRIPGAPAKPTPDSPKPLPPEGSPATPPPAG